MSEADHPMPRFDRPPVIETILGVFFQPVESFTVVRRSQFWVDNLEQEFPIVEERAPLDEIHEEFGGFSVASEPVVRWLVGPPSPRLWAKSTDGTHTIQLQNNALLANWEREPNQQGSYLHYGSRRDVFARRLRTLDQFLHDKLDCGIQPTSCLVTYINHIELDEGVEVGSFLQSVITVWRNETSDGYLPMVESAKSTFAFAMPERLGRLHVSVATAIRNKDRKPIIRLEFTARSAPIDSKIDAALLWLDKGHEWIVRGFASLTCREMHTQWGRTQ